MSKKSLLGICRYPLIPRMLQLMLIHLVRLETVTRESELNTSSPTLTTSTAPDLSQLTCQRQMEKVRCQMSIKL